MKKEKVLIICVIDAHIHAAGNKILYHAFKAGSGTTELLLKQ